MFKLNLRPSVTHTYICICYWKLKHDKWWLISISVLLMSMRECRKNGYTYCYTLLFFVINCYTLIKKTNSFSVACMRKPWERGGSSKVHTSNLQSFRITFSQEYLYFRRYTELYCIFKHTKLYFMVL